MSNSKVNPDNTLTVQYLLNAIADKRTTVNMPIGIIIHGDFKIIGICAFELHKFDDGQTVFVIHSENVNRPVSQSAGDRACEVGLV